MRKFFVGTDTDGLNHFETIPDYAVQMRHANTLDSWYTIAQVDEKDEARRIVRETDADTEIRIVGPEPWDVEPPAGDADQYITVRTVEEEDEYD